MDGRRGPEGIEGDTGERGDTGDTGAASILVTTGDKPGGMAVGFLGIAAVTGGGGSFMDGGGSWGGGPGRMGGGLGNPGVKEAGGGGKVVGGGGGLMEAAGEGTPGGRGDMPGFTEFKLGGRGKLPGEGFILITALVETSVEYSEIAGDSMAETAEVSVVVMGDRACVKGDSKLSEREAETGVADDSIPDFFNDESDII